ncbi:hypothetical protein N2152v2_006686 [Parachlorella kessleri]
MSASCGPESADQTAFDGPRLASVASTPSDVVEEGEDYGSLLYQAAPQATQETGFAGSSGSSWLLQQWIMSLELDPANLPTNCVGTANAAAAAATAGEPDLQWPITAAPQGTSASSLIRLARASTEAQMPGRPSVTCSPDISPFLPKAGLSVRLPLREGDVPLPSSPRSLLRVGSYASSCLSATSDSSAKAGQPRWNGSPRVERRPSQPSTPPGRGLRRVASSPNLAQHACSNSGSFAPPAPQDSSSLAPPPPLSCMGVVEPPVQAAVMSLASEGVPLGSSGGGPRLLKRSLSGGARSASPQQERPRTVQRSFSRFKEGAGQPYAAPEDSSCHSGNGNSGSAVARPATSRPNIAGTWGARGSGRPHAAAALHRSASSPAAPLARSSMMRLPSSLRKQASPRTTSTSAPDAAGAAFLTSDTTCSPALQGACQSDGQVMSEGLERVVDPMDAHLDTLNRLLADLAACNITMEMLCMD